MKKSQKKLDPPPQEKKKQLFGGRSHSNLYLFRKDNPVWSSPSNQLWGKLGQKHDWQLKLSINVFIHSWMV